VKQRDYHLAKLREDFPNDQKWVKRAMTAFPERHHFTAQPWQDDELWTYEVPVFENEHMIQLMRALDHKIGTEQKTLLVPAYDKNQKIPFTLKVVGHEEIKTKAGTFSCAKIETSINQTYYISQENDRKLVRIDFGNIQMDLLSVEKWQQEESRVLSSQNLGITYEIPGLVLHTPVVDTKEVYREQIWMSDFNGIHGLVEVNLKENLTEKARESSWSGCGWSLPEAQKRF